MSASIVLQNNHSVIALPVGVESPASGDGLARSRAFLNTHNGLGENVAPQGHDVRTLAPGAVGQTRTPGQLWERVAQGRAINYDVYPWGCLNAVKGSPYAESERGRPVCIAGMGFRGMLGRHVCGDHHSHGIISAGVRAK